MELPKSHIARFAKFDIDNLRFCAPIQLSDGSVSNGSWALKSKFIPANLQKRLDKYDDPHFNQNKLEEFLPDQSEPAELSTVYTNEAGIGIAVLENQDKTFTVYLDADYYSYLIRWGFTVEVTDDLVPQAIKHDGQIAGVIMPITK